VTEWRVGGKLKRTLYRDDQLVGLVDTGEIAREIVHRMNLIPIVVPDGLESGRERSLTDPGTGEPVGTSPCRCQLCQSGEDRYESRCGVCEALVTVVRGRVEEHGEEGARCPGSGEDAG
jgi:hypothetical protein